MDLKRTKLGQNMDKLHHRAFFLCLLCLSLCPSLPRGFSSCHGDDPYQSLLPSLDWPGWRQKSAMKRRRKTQPTFLFGHPSSPAVHSTHTCAVIYWLSEQRHLSNRRISVFPVTSPSVRHSMQARDIRGVLLHDGRGSHPRTRVPCSVMYRVPCTRPFPTNTTRPLLSFCFISAGRHLRRSKRERV